MTKAASYRVAEVRNQRSREPVAGAPQKTLQDSPSSKKIRDVDEGSNRLNIHRHIGSQPTSDQRTKPVADRCAWVITKPHRSINERVAGDQGAKHPLLATLPIGLCSKDQMRKEIDHRRNKEPDTR